MTSQIARYLLIYAMSLYKHLEGTMACFECHLNALWCTIFYLYCILHLFIHLMHKYLYFRWGKYLRTNSINFKNITYNWTGPIGIVSIDIIYIFVQWLFIFDFWMPFLGIPFTKFEIWNDLKSISLPFNWWIGLLSTNFLMVYDMYLNCEMWLK